MKDKEHWEGIYGRKESDQVSWYRPHLERSIGFIEQACVTRDAAIIDVGGGASTLVDDLLARGYLDVTVLDLSSTAIEVAKVRLGARASAVKWIVGDITQVELPPNTYDFWHDRAVFHFLREAEDRRRYVDAVGRALKPGGHILVATFGPEGPERCSGLDVVRYSADGLHAEFGHEFAKVASVTESHTTPWGSEQQFVYRYQPALHAAGVPERRARRLRRARQRARHSLADRLGRDPGRHDQVPHVSHARRQPG